MIDLTPLPRAIAPRVLVARPYATSLRDRVSSVLTKIGLDIEGGELIPSGTPDDEAIEAIVASRCDVLLIPFNAHRGPDGNLLDGLTLCRRLTAHPQASSRPVLMPVSRMAAANLRLTSHAGEHASHNTELLDTQILVIEDDDVEEVETTKRIRDHLRTHGIRV